MSQDSSASSSSSPSPLTTENPPETIGGILKRLGPGLIVAGSIVGSGELIATTLVGAKAGFWLLWLIIIGCVIKVFVQVELGRYTIIHGKTTMHGMNEVPGPSLGRGNWLLWFWLLMFLASLGQLGGIVGGVGQALSISVPLTQQGRDYNELLDDETLLTVAKAELVVEEQRKPPAENITDLKADIQDLKESVITGRISAANVQIDDLKKQAAANTDGAQEKLTLWEKSLATAQSRVQSSQSDVDPSEIFADLPEEFGTRTAYDHMIWASIIGVLTSIILYVGRYNLIQSFSTVMVFSFTLLTVVNLV
jgi:hypothetical protein